MKKYRIKGSSTHIEVVEVERDTDRNVWVDGQRISKKSGYFTYYDTWEVAHQILFFNAEKKVENLEYVLEGAKADLQKIINLKPGE